MTAHHNLRQGSLWSPESFQTYFPSLLQEAFCFASTGSDFGTHKSVIVCYTSHVSKT